MTDKLKPCPFCGCEGIRMLTSIDGCDIWCDRCFASIRRSTFRICKNGAEAKKEAQLNAVRAWNRRADNDR